jgi:hypothetical protein
MRVRDVALDVVQAAIEVVADGFGQVVAIHKFFGMSIAEADGQKLSTRKK